MKDKAKSIIVISRVLLWLFIVSMAVLVISVNLAPNEEAEIKLPFVLVAFITIVIVLNIIMLTVMCVIQIIKSLKERGIRFIGHEILMKSAIIFVVLMLLDKLILKNEETIIYYLSMALCIEGITLSMEYRNTLKEEVKLNKNKS